MSFRGGGCPLAFETSRTLKRGLKDVPIFSDVKLKLSFFLFFVERIKSSFVDLRISHFHFQYLNPRYEFLFRILRSHVADNTEYCFLVEICDAM